MEKHLYQNVGTKLNPRYVLNFHKLAKEPANFWIILSGREHQGKTTNALQFAREQYIKHGYKTVCFYNTKNMIENKTKLISANKKFYPDDWKNVKVGELGIYDVPRQEHFIYFAYVNNTGSFKIGGRDPDIRYIIYDEFNENWQQTIGDKQVSNFESLLQSSFQSFSKKHIRDQYKVFILGNVQTVTTPLLSRMNVKHLPKQELEVMEYGKFIVNLFNPRTLNEKELHKQMQDNWLFSMSKMFGNLDTNYIGDMLKDDLTCVVPPDLHYRYKVKHNNRYLKVGEYMYLKSWYSKDNNPFFEYVEEIPENAFVICIKRKYQEAGVKFSSELKKQLDMQLQQGMLYFDSSTSKVRLLMNLVNIKL